MTSVIDEIPFAVRREMAAGLLISDPILSNREIGRRANVTGATVARIRRRAESSGLIPVAAREDREARFYESKFGDLETRFWARVDRSGGPTACWPCAGGDDGQGYASVRVGRRVIRAHRLAYLMLVGPVPDGLQLDHLCRNRRCANPAHLEPVTSAVNTLRGISPFAANARKTHCKRGHEFTPENTRIEQPGDRRRCIACRRELGLRAWHRRTTCAPVALRT